MGEFRPWPKPEKSNRIRRSDVNLSDWRRQVMEKYRWRCASCGWQPKTVAGREKLEAHHLIFKSRCKFQYLDDPRNGIALCGPWVGNCHANVHEARLKIKPEWLPADVTRCLEEQGLTWGADGVPAGTLAKYFATKETT